MPDSSQQRNGQEIALKPYPDRSISGHVVVVTGASMGIGYGLAKAYANEGAKVAACARNMAKLDDLVTEIEEEGGEAAAYLLDVSNVPSIEAVMLQVRHDFGRLDILMNNAGLGDNHPATEVTEADWDPMFTVNTKGAFFVAQACGRLMLETGYGRIVNMSSQASVIGIRDHAVYCASKGAVNQFTRVLALEWAPFGVTVNAIGPTFIYTPGTAERLDDPAFRNDIEARIPVGRVGTVADVAAAAIFLSTPGSALITGQHLAVDGGWTAQ